jgi:asparagine synthase (glutamine-hydrolysing)
MGKLLSNVAKPSRSFGFWKPFKRLRHRIWRLGCRISAKDFESFYANLLSLSLTPVSIVDWPSGLPLHQTTTDRIAAMDIEQRMMFIDQCTYLPDDVLVKTDRASMSLGLELRVPFLDSHLIEFAWRLPSHMHRKNENGKLLLRRLLYRYVPRKLIDRPKKGFDIPQDEWLRGPLRSWMMDLLEPTSLRNAGYIDAFVVQHLIKEHLSGIGDHGYALWPLLMFQAWLAKQ